jgi:hypothetical protein
MKIQWDILELIPIDWYHFSVSDMKGLDQPACQEEWKMCRKRRIVMPM